LPSPLGARGVVSSPKPNGEVRLLVTKVHRAPFALLAEGTAPGPCQRRGRSYHRDRADCEVRPRHADVSTGSVRQIGETCPGGVTSATRTIIPRSLRAIWPPIFTGRSCGWAAIGSRSNAGPGAPFRQIRPILRLFAGKKIVALIGFGARASRCGRACVRSRSSVGECVRVANLGAERCRFRPAAAVTLRQPMMWRRCRPAAAPGRRGRHGELDARPFHRPVVQLAQTPRAAAARQVPARHAGPRNADDAGQYNTVLQQNASWLHCANRFIPVVAVPQTGIGWPGSDGQGRMARVGRPGSVREDRCRNR
jgi:hypothetical protein